MTHLKDRERERRLEKIRGKSRNGNGDAGKPAASGAITLDKREAARIADDLGESSMRIEKVLLTLTKASVDGVPLPAAKARELAALLDESAITTHHALMCINRKRGFA